MKDERIKLREELVDSLTNTLQLTDNNDILRSRCREHLRKISDLKELVLFLRKQLEEYMGAYEVEFLVMSFNVPTHDRLKVWMGRDSEESLEVKFDHERFNKTRERAIELMEEVKTITKS